MDTLTMSPPSTSTASRTVSSRAHWRVYLTGLAAVIGGSFLGYAAVAVYAVLMTRSAATHGALDVVEMLPPLGWTMAGAGFGVVAGRFLPPLVAPVAAPIVPYLLLTVGVTVDFSADRTFFGDLFGLDDSARDYLRVPVELLVGKSLLWVLLGTAVLAWTFRAGRVAYALVVTAGFAAAACFLVAGARDDVPAEYAVTCLGDSPRVCTDRAHDHLLTQYHRLVRRQLERTDGLSLAGYTVVQSANLLADARHFTGQVPDPDAGQLVVEIAKGYTSPAHQIDERAFIARFGMGLFVTPCLAGPPQDGASPNGGLARSMALYTWWLRHNDLPTNGSNYTGDINADYALAENPDLAQRVQRFSALTDADRSAWWQRNQRNVLTCAPGADR